MQSTCCVPGALEARRQRNWPCNFCPISLLLMEVLCFGEMCADRPSLNSWGLVQHAAAVTGCWIALAEFGGFAAGRVNAVYGRRKEDLYFRAASCWGLEKPSTASILALGRVKELTKYSFDLFEAAFISPEGGEWSSQMLGGMCLIQDCPFSLTPQTLQRKIKTCRKRLSDRLTCFAKSRIIWLLSETL